MLLIANCFLVNCTVPVQPINGLMLGEDHSLGANITLQCSNGYRPSSPTISYCTQDEVWIPEPDEYNCTFVVGNKIIDLCINSLVMINNIISIASMDLTSSRNMSEDRIDCPGDTILYNCSITSNSEDLYLQWEVILPNMHLITTVFDGTALDGIADDLDMNISATLTRYTRDEYIESTLILTLLRGVNMNGTIINCLSNIVNGTELAQFNTSGIMPSFVSEYVYSVVWEICIPTTD